MKTIQYVTRYLMIAIVVSGCAATRTQESTGEYLDDAAITTKVKASLMGDPAVSGLAIGVETFKGIVQLSGFVDSRFVRERAAALASQSPGVRLVKNDIRLKIAKSMGDTGGY